MRTEIVHEVYDLFSWAKAEAARIAEAKALQVERVKREQDAALALEMEPTMVALAQAKLDLKNAKKAVLEEDLAVQDAKEAVKHARKRTKGLPSLAAHKEAKAAAKAGEASIRADEAGLAQRLAGGGE
jgi:hypothetical protein